MAQAAIRMAEAPTPALEVIDRGHLKRMTFGDRSLEHELLQLFDRQAEILLARMQASDPATVATLAHTMKGSALGIAAGAVAQAAEAAELAAAGTPVELAAAIARLAQTIAQARAQIALLLRAA
jgi:HPt (histidine-containing phosphotransfer) domain-containing protein